MPTQGPATRTIEELRSRFETSGQAQVFRFWDQLDAEAKDALRRQADRLDLEALVRGFRATQGASGAPPKLEPPDVIELPSHGGDAAHWDAARARGEALLAGGQVGVMVVAGGQATRLGYPGPKGLYPLGPVSERSLFAIQAQKIRRLRDRFDAAIPWYVMTSAATDARTREAFAEADHFGLPAEDVFFLTQGMVPSFDFEGRLMLAAPDRIFENPDGHGGSLIALLASGALDDMARRGVSTLFYYQVDNPLIPIGDPALLGFHAETGAEMSCKSLRKREPGEKMGVFANVDGRLGVVEYTEIDAAHREATDDRGELLFGAGNVAVHAFEVDFVRRIAAEADRWLPFHASAKKIPTVDDAGRPVAPSEPNGFKLERFVFDALPAAARVSIVEASRDEYSPVKNAEGGESPATSRRDLSAQYRRWIEQADLPSPASDRWIEIDESQVGSADDLRALGLSRIEEAPDCIQTRVGDDA